MVCQRAFDVIVSRKPLSIIRWFHWLCERNPVGFIDPLGRFRTHFPAGNAHLARNKHPFAWS